MSRVFLVGNGPSLKDTPLDRLIGEEAWGMNRIHLLYDRIQWRPTLWWWTDMPQRPEHEEDIKYHVFDLQEPCMIRRDVVEWKMKDVFTPVPKNVQMWDYCVHHNSSHYDRNRPEWWHIGYDKYPEKDPIDKTIYCKFGSGMSVMLQHAVCQGYKDIYLLGCDLGAQPHEPGADDTFHFHPDYWTWEYKVLRTQEWADRINKTLEYAHIIAERSIRAYYPDVRVTNATVGGFLEVWPRADINEILDA